MDGIGIWRSEWVQERKEYSKAYYDTLPDEEGNEVKVYGGREDSEDFAEYWTWSKRKPEDCAWEPSTRLNVHKSPWFRDRAKKTLNELLIMEEEGRIANVEAIKDFVPSSLPAGQREMGKELIERYKNGERAHPYSDERVYQVDEWWGSVLWEHEGKVEYGDVNGS